MLSNYFLIGILVALSLGACSQQAAVSQNYDYLYEKPLCDFLETDALVNALGASSAKKTSVMGRPGEMGSMTRCLVSFVDYSKSNSFSLMVQGVLTPNPVHVEQTLAAQKRLEKEGLVTRMDLVPGAEAFYNGKLNSLFVFTHPDRYISIGTGMISSDPEINKVQQKWIINVAGLLFSIE